MPGEVAGKLQAGQNARREGRKRPGTEDPAGNARRGGRQAAGRAERPETERTPGGDCGPEEPAGGPETGRTADRR